MAAGGVVGELASGEDAVSDYLLCKECDQPILRKGQVRTNPSEYRHANGCPLDDWPEWAKKIEALPIGVRVDLIRLLQHAHMVDGVFKSLADKDPQWERAALQYGTTNVLEPLERLKATILPILDDSVDSARWVTLP